MHITTQSNMLTCCDAVPQSDGPQPRLVRVHDPAGVLRTAKTVLLASAGSALGGGHWAGGLAGTAQDSRCSA